jgi:hypothetical protein
MSHNEELLGDQSVMVPVPVTGFRLMEQDKENSCRSVNLSYYGRN